MAQKANNTSVMSALFKEVYADKLLSLVPAAARIQRDAKYVQRDKQEGNKYHQPVRLTRAHGWTLDTSGDAFALNPPEPAQSKDATVQGSSFVLREAISYDAAAKLLKGQGESQRRAFVGGTSYMIENMTETAAFVLELQCLHGQSDIGVVDAYVSGTGTDTQLFTILAGDFIAAMWSGLEQGFVDFHDASTGAILNTRGEVQVTAVDIENRKITFLGVAADLDAVHAATNPQIYLRGTKSAGMLGIVSQVANTGNMFGINAANYSLWAGNSYSASSGPLAFAKVMRALNKPVARGLMSDVRMYCNPKGWTDSQNDLAALRRYAAKAGGTLEQGADDLTFYGQAGSVSLVPHIFMKPSQAVVVPKDKMIRLGASELTFSPPGWNDGEFWENLPDNAGYGTRCYWNQAIFIPTPAQCLLVSSIVNSDD